MIADYCKEDIERVLRDVGIRPGAVVFSHSNLGYFGRPAGATSSDGLCRLFLQAFQNVLGANGTLAVPTFSYSFGSEKPDKVFDVGNTPSVCGLFSEYVRQLPQAWRSSDPMFSVAAIGRKAETLTRSVDPECFGEDSFWNRFLKYDGIFCNLNFDAASTFIHFAERRLGVGYRKNRVFHGTVVEHGKSRSTEAVYFSRNLDDPSAIPSFVRFHRLATKAGLVRVATLGRGAITAISAADKLRFIAKTLPQEPQFLTVGGTSTPIRH